MIISCKEKTRKKRKTLFIWIKMDTSLHFSCFSVDQCWRWPALSYRKYLSNLISVDQGFSTLAHYWYFGQRVLCCGAVLCILQYSPASSRYSLDVSSNLHSLPGNQKYFGKYIDKCPLMSKITSIENHWGT